MEGSRRRLLSPCLSPSRRRVCSASERLAKSFGSSPNGHASPLPPRTAAASRRARRSPTRTAWCRGVTQAAFLARWSAPTAASSAPRPPAAVRLEVPRPPTTPSGARRCSGASRASPSSRRFGSAPARISARTAPTARTDEAATCRVASPVPRDRRLREPRPPRAEGFVRGSKRGVDARERVRRFVFKRQSRIVRRASSRPRPARRRPARNRSRPSSSLAQVENPRAERTTRAPARPRRQHDSRRTRRQHAPRRRRPAERAAARATGRRQGLTPSLQTRTRVLFLKRETRSSKISPWSSQCSWIVAVISRPPPVGRARTPPAARSRPRASSAGRPRRGRAGTATGTLPCSARRRAPGSRRQAFAPDHARLLSHRATDDACVFFFSDSAERRPPFQERSPARTIFSRTRRDGRRSSSSATRDRLERVAWRAAASPRRHPASRRARRRSRPSPSSPPRPCAWSSSARFPISNDPPPPPRRNRRRTRRSRGGSTRGARTCSRARPARTGPRPSRAGSGTRPRRPRAPRTPPA